MKATDTTMVLGRVDALHHLAAFAQELQKRMCAGATLEELEKWCHARANEDINLPYMLRQRVEGHDRCLVAAPEVSILDRRKHLADFLTGWSPGNGCYPWVEFWLDYDAGGVYLKQYYTRDGYNYYYDLFHPRLLLCKIKPYKGGPYEGVVWVRPKQ